MRLSSTYTSLEFFQESFKKKIQFRKFATPIIFEDIGKTNKTLITNLKKREYKIFTITKNNIKNI